MELYLVRHTTPDIEKGICYGQSDIPVTSNFEYEAKEVLKKLPVLDDSFTVYSSPLKRCKLLAQTISKTTIIYDNRLKELDFGDWELKKWDAIDTNELTPWMNDFVNKKTTNGESYIDLNQRILEFMHSISTNKKVVLFTHAGVIRVILSYINKVTLKDSFDFKIAYGEVKTITTSSFKNN